MAEGGKPTGKSPETSTESDDSSSTKKKSTFTVDIKEICSNVKYRLQFQSMDRVGEVGEIENLKETPYITDAWFDHNKTLGKYAWYGEKKGKRRLVREYVTHALAIKTLQDRAREKADIEKVREAFSERDIECYNMRAVIAYLGAAKGVTVAPDVLVRFLRAHKVAKAGKAYENARKSDYLKKLRVGIKELNKSLTTLEEYVEKRKTYLDNHPIVTSAPVSMDVQSLKVTNAQRKIFARKLAERVGKDMKKKFNEFGYFFWDFRRLSEEADACLFDFLMKYIPNLCKLNPVPTGKKPKLFK